MLFHKRLHNDRHHPHHDISGYPSPNVTLIQPLGKTHLHQHANNRKNMSSSLVSLNLQSPVMCGGRRISFPISPQLNKLHIAIIPSYFRRKASWGMVTCFRRSWRPLSTIACGFSRREPLLGDAYHHLMHKNAGSSWALPHLR